MVVNIDQFHAQLRSCGEYSTPKEFRVERARRIGFGARISYYAALWRIIGHAALTAYRGGFDRRNWARHGFEILRLTEAFGATVHFSGFHSPPGVCVWAANHMSSLETFVLPAAIQAFGDVAVVVKQSLMRYPVFGATVRATEPIAVTRKDPREDLKRVLFQGERYLRAGRSVLLFPQSTRSQVFDFNLFNSIAVKLAHRAGVPVMPLALATDFCGIGKIWKDWGPIRPDRPVRFQAGRPIAPTLHPREAQRELQTFIADRLSAWNFVVKRENK